MKKQGYKYVGAVYHGTDSEIERFSLAKAEENRKDISGTSGTGIFFTSDKEVAEGYSKTGKTYKAWVELEEPVVIYAEGQSFGSISIRTEIESLGAGMKLRDLIGDNLNETNSSDEGTVDTNTIARLVRDQGCGEYYDGIIVRNVVDCGLRGKELDKVSDVVIVFNDEAIKLRSNE